MRNVRIAAFLLLISAPFAWFLYLFIHQQMTHGVSVKGDKAYVDLKALGNFPFDQENGSLRDVPSQFRQLDGKRVVLDGFMFVRGGSAPRVRQFEFVYNINKCCFTGPPLVQERVYAFVPDHDTVPFVDFCRLTGILHVNVQKEAGKVQTVYTLDVERLDPAT